MVPSTVGVAEAEMSAVGERSSVGVVGVGKVDSELGTVTARGSVVGVVRLVDGAVAWLGRGVVVAATWFARTDPALAPGLVPPPAEVLVPPPAEVADDAPALPGFAVPVSEGAATTGGSGLGAFTRFEALPCGG